MLTLTNHLLITNHFMPHGTCYLWKAGLVGLHSLSNGIIALSYFSIPLSIIYITDKRQDLPFNWIFFLFAAFIISCGIGHSMDIWTLWYPNYWLSAYIRAITAIVSLITAIALVYLIPKIINLPSPKQIEVANRQLLQEIEERKQLEEALRKSEERWQLVLKGTGDGIFDWNIITNEAFMSPSLKENLGYQDQEIANEYDQWSKLVHSDDLEIVKTAVEDHLQGHTSQYVCEYRMKSKENGYQWVLARGMAQWDENGQPIRMVGSHQDVTPRKEAEAEIQRLNQELEQRVIRRTLELERRNQELDQFAYVTSHDLKAPLRAIANLSEWLEEDLEDKLDQDTRQQMNLLRGRVHRMENLINGLLDYYRVGKLKSRTETINLAKLIEEISDFLLPPPEFKIEFLGTVSQLRTERLPLQQVLSNLIGNGIKHHNRLDGKVTISVEDQGTYYQFAIADDGPGISPEYHQKVFEIFQTLEARDKTENTGIGLSIVKKTLENRGGNIELESKLDHGTIFRFTWLKLMNRE